MKIHWQVDVPLPEEYLSLIQRGAEEALRAEGIQLPCAVGLRLCDDEAIAAMNRELRGVNRATDVLSFPTVNYPAGKTAGACEALLRREYDDELNACYLGDIVISVPHLRAQAEEYGHSPRREAAYLAVHGLCHLMGYDHMEDNEKERMRRMEETVLSAVNVPRDDQDLRETLLSLARQAMENSYSPYSHFPVGAAIHSVDGRIFQGANIENASFGLTICAERTAVFKAVSEGAREFDLLAIASKTIAWPCGACRQVLREFAPDLRILITWEDQVREMTLKELLPESFGPESLING